MLFYSYGFLFAFLPVVLIGFAMLRPLGMRLSLLWLAGASLAFYACWRIEDLPIIVGSMVFNYAVGKWLLRVRSKGLLALGVAVNLALLGYFKYAVFLDQTLHDLVGQRLGVGAIVLPLAISFFTFQQIAYLADAYRREVVPHGFLEYVLFVSFFPQLIAGPIVQQKQILPQLRRWSRLRLSGSHFAIGLSMFTLGLAKKVIIADSVAPFATPAFDAAAQGASLSMIEAWGAALAYTFQIYFDFSGYSDMAIGLARMFGVRLPTNFDSPYKSQSVSEFWRRWHITLSQFLRDYLYIPLGGNRRGEPRRLANLMIVMLLGGLWHGASWTFAVWGGLHGVFLIINHGVRRARKSMGLSEMAPPSVRALGRSASWAVTFLAVVFAWVVFRAESLEVAWQICGSMAGANGLALPAAWQPALGPAAAWLSVVGVRFEPAASMPFFGGVYQWTLLAVLLVVATRLPNSQQWMIHARPTADRIAAPSGALWRRLAWRPTPAHALATGVLLTVAIFSYWRMSTPPEFIYFNF